MEESIWIKIPEAITRLVLSFLVDGGEELGILEQLSSPLKNPFAPVEDDYRLVCVSCYPAFREENVSRKWGSYRSMFINRIRVRSNGFYTLPLRYFRRPTNDKFWENEDDSDILIFFYRHLRFLKDDWCLYCLDVKSPDEIAAALESHHASTQASADSKIFKGKYCINRKTGHVEVVVDMKYTVMYFKFLVKSNEPSRGKFCVLELVHHSSLGKRVQLEGLLGFSPIRGEGCTRDVSLEDVLLHRGAPWQSEVAQQILEMSHSFEIPPHAELRYRRHWYWG